MNKRVVRKMGIFLGLQLSEMFGWVIPCVKAIGKVILLYSAAILIIFCVVYLLINYMQIIATIFLVILSIIAMCFIIGFVFMFVDWIKDNWRQAEVELKYKEDKVK